MKKVLCFIDTLGIRGGAERQMIGLVQLFRQRGYHTDVVIYHDNPALPKIKELYGVVPTILKVRNSRLSKVMAVRNYIKQNGGYDWVIAYKTGPNVIGCLLKLFGLRFKLIVSERSTTQIIGLSEKVQFFLYRMANYIVPNSQSQANFIKANFPSLGKKTKVITNFTDTTLFTPRYTELGKTFNILTTARLSEAKNILRYLDAIALLKKRGVRNLHFNWYGELQPGEEEYGKEVLNKVQRLGLNDMITFHPATPDIVEKYQECDAFCLPSNYEGFPNVICEAMSCGKPIVCSRVCDIPYIVKEGENALLFDNTSVEDIADKIQSISSMSQVDLNKWGHRSREIAEAILSRDAFIDKYIELIEK